MSTVSLTLQQIGDGFVKLQPILTSSNGTPSTWRNDDLKIIQRVNILYNHSGLITPGKFQVTDLASGTLRGPDNVLSRFIGYNSSSGGGPVQWNPPAFGANAVDIVLYSSNTYTSDPEGYGRPLLNILNGYQTIFRVEIIGTDAAGGSTRIVSNPVTATPVGAPATPVIIRNTPVSDTSFKLTVNTPTDDGGHPIDKIYAYLSIPNTEVQGNTRYETRNLTGNRFEFLTKTFRYPADVTFSSNGLTFDILFDASSNFTDASYGILPDTVYDIYINFSNGTSLSPDSNIYKGYPSDKPGQPTITTLRPADRSVTVNFTPPSNSYFSYIKGLVVADVSGNPTDYFKNTSTGFVYVSNFSTGLTEINNNTANIAMDSTLQYNFTITGLTNNNTYTRKFYLVNSYGNGVPSADFSIIAQAPPSNIQNLAITPIPSVPGPLPNISSSYYPSQIIALANQQLIDYVPLDVTFNDPALNWPSTHQSGINYYYKTNIVAVDSSASAISVAMKRFYGQGGTSVSTNSSDNLLDPVIVYNDLNNCINAINNSVTGVSNWVTTNLVTAISDASKNTFLSNIRPALSISIPQAILALNEYFKIMAFNNYLLNDVSYNVVPDIAGATNTLNAIRLTNASNDRIYVPAGTFIKIQVAPFIEIPANNTYFTSTTPSTVQTFVKTNNLGAPTLTYRTTPHTIIATISQPIFTYGYNISANYILKLTNNLTSAITSQNIPVASGVPPNIFIANKQWTFSSLDNGISYNLEADLNYTTPPSTQLIFKSTNANGIIAYAAPSPISLINQTISYTPNTPNATIQFQPLTTAQFDGTLYSYYEFQLIDNSVYSTTAFDTAISSGTTVSPASYYSATPTPLISGFFASCTNVPTGSGFLGRQFYFIGRVAATIGVGGATVFSDWSRSATFTVSGAPIGQPAPLITNNSNTIDVTWTYPTNDGTGNTNGSNISSYALMVYDSTGALVNPVRSATNPGTGPYTLLSNTFVTPNFTDSGISKSALGLVSGNTYTFAIKATSSNGLFLVGTQSMAVQISSPISFPTPTTVPTIDNLSSSGTARTVTVPINLNGSTINQIAVMYTTSANGLGTTYQGTIHANTFGAYSGGVSTASNVYYVRNNTTSSFGSASYNINTGLLTVDIAPVLNNILTPLTASTTTPPIVITHAVVIINDNNSYMIIAQV